MPLISDSVYDSIEAIENEAHNKIIEAIAAELCQMRFTLVINESAEFLRFDENGDFYIDAILDYNSNDEMVVLEFYPIDKSYYGMMEIFDTNMQVYHIEKLPES